MNRIFFIVALILIFEVSFRLWPAPPKDDNGKLLPPVEYHFYPFQQDETDSVRWYVYHIFEHVKVILFAVIVTIVFSRCSFLIWMFSIDLASFLLNYYSTWTHVYGVPIGCDTVKLAIFGYVVIREALHGYYPDHFQCRSVADHGSTNNYSQYPTEQGKGSGGERAGNPSN